jgi:hypothetical protein
VKKRYKLAIVLLGVFAAAQLIRHSRENPRTDPKSAIAAHYAVSSSFVSVLDRSCNACHSNSTAWPWYTEIAPLSWYAVGAVKKARQSVNFSNWDRYSPDQRRQLLQASCVAASNGAMPGGFYTALEPKARLSAEDIRTICGAAQVASEERQ